MIRFSSSAIVRRRTMSRVVLTAVTVAAMTYTTIACLAKQIDDRRLEQLRVSRFDTNMTMVLGDLDSFLLGEEVESFDDDFRQMEVSLDAIVKNGDPEELAPIRREYRGFTAALRKQNSAVRSGQMPIARRLDLITTDPAFERLKEEISTLDSKLQAEVAFWTVVVDVATGLSLLASALLVASLIIRSQRKMESIVHLEAQQHLVESSERRLRSLIQNSTDVIALVTAEGVVTMISDACERTWERGAAEMVGESIFGAMDPADAAKMSRSLAEQASTAVSVPSFEVAMVDPRGVRRSFEVQIANLLKDPDVSGVLLTFHDLTERKEYESELTYHAFHDRLTTLPNRSLFLDRLTHRLKTAQSGRDGFAVLFIDLDNFKIINDSLGHEAGDTLLIEVAARLQAAVRPADTVARMGGDEFTIILDEATLEIATEVAERIGRTLVAPTSLGEREVFVTSSIGIVMTADSGPDAADLLRDADTAMYQAKGNGKASLAIFEPSMNLRALDRLELESDLRVAIAEEQFFLAYQPIVDIATGRLREVEALIRWQHPIRGLVSPGAFIPLAEETGLICPIGRWALRQSFAQLGEWNRDLTGGDRLRLSVNVSGRQLQEKEFVDEVKAMLVEMDMDPSLVELEVTETAMLNDLVKMKGVFTQIRDLGLRVAIDDFGTGYSSMAYLSHLPVDKLKIDRSFVIPLGSDDRAGGVVQAMITMAHTLGLGTTGEGVETQEQWEALQDMGCDLAQGFLFDRPLTPDSVTHLLSDPGKTRSLDALPMAA